RTAVAARRRSLASSPTVWSPATGQGCRLTAGPRGRRAGAWVGRWSGTKRNKRAVRLGTPRLVYISTNQSKGVVSRSVCPSCDGAVETYKNNAANGNTRDGTCTTTITPE